MGMNKKIEEVFTMLGFYGFFDMIENVNDIKSKVHRHIFPIEINCPLN